MTQGGVGILDSLLYMEVLNAAKSIKSSFRSPGKTHGGHGGRQLVDQRTGQSTHIAHSMRRIGRRFIDQGSVGELTMNAKKLLCFFIDIGIAADDREKITHGLSVLLADS